VQGQGSKTDHARFITGLKLELKTKGFPEKKKRERGGKGKAQKAFIIKPSIRQQR